MNKLLTQRNLRIGIFILTAIYFYYWAKENRPEWFDYELIDFSPEGNTPNPAPASVVEEQNFDENRSYDDVANRNWTTDESNNNVININIDPDLNGGYSTT